MSRSPDSLGSRRGYSFPSWLATWLAGREIFSCDPNLSPVFASHMVGDLKRVEEMCERLKLRLGRRSRPAKLQAGKP